MWRMIDSVVQCRGDCSSDERLRMKRLVRRAVCGLGRFSWWSYTSDLNIGTPVATLPGAWHYWVSAGTGGSGVSIL